ncbi:MAG TPA: 2-phosphosulfolactate phosphatase [Chloroflexota bacterium]|nr:2-phosphosulfolactate phosphatase [Chloroflexota bacterium]
MRKTVVIDCFPESVPTYPQGYAIVAVDVIRATTTAVTGVALGRRCFPAPTLEAAVPLAARLRHPLLVGELGGRMPYGFDITNSPVEVEARTDIQRPMLLLSTSGTRLICGAAAGQVLYVACLRNYRAQIAHLAAHHPAVAVVGAGSRGEFREEDQLCCAWIAAGLLAAGYAPQNERTLALVEWWASRPLDAIVDGASAAYLRNTGQARDLEFILTHVDDLDAVYRFERGQVVELNASRTMVWTPQHRRQVIGDRRQHARPTAAYRLDS